MKLLPTETEISVAISRHFTSGQVLKFRKVSRGVPPLKLPRAAVKESVINQLLIYFEVALFAYIFISLLEQEKGAVYH